MRRSSLTLLAVVLGLSGSAAHGPAITTKLSDTYKQMPQLDWFAPAHARSLTWLPRTASGNFVLLPGAYRWSVQSYCLNAGKHAPRSDAAYLAAPLQGPGAAHLIALLQKNERSGLAQSDLQGLVWMTASGQTMAGELAKLQQLLRGFGQPAQLGATLATLVAAPGPANNHGVPRNRWSYVRPGYFIRLTNSSYTRVAVEIYVPERWRLGRDASHRVNRLSNATGSKVDVTYGGNGANARVTEPYPMPDRATSMTADLPLAYDGGAGQTDAVALRGLETAIRASSGATRGPPHLRDVAADDVARTRAELVCKNVPCGVTAQDFPHVPVVTSSVNALGNTVFSLSGTAAVPTDASLQPLALSGRGEGGGSPPTSTTTTAPKSADKNADCPEVAEQIAVEKFARAMYANARYVAMANARHKDGPTYNGVIMAAMNATYDAASNNDANSKAVSSEVQSLFDSPAKTAASAPTGIGDEVVPIAATDPETCLVSESMNAFRVPAVVRDALVAHEEVHAATCASRSKADRQRLDTPASRGADEVRAYDVSIAYLEKWYAENCR